MSQSAILRHCYEEMFHRLEELGKGSPAFTVRDGGYGGEKKDKGPEVFLGVTDASQISQDKNGEKVYVGEKSYPEPTYVGCVFSLTVSAQKYSEALEIAGAIIRCLKDEPSLPLGEYNWHGNDRDKVFLEPVVRQPEGGAGGSAVSPCLTICYRLEAAINSAKEEDFTRVQRRDIRSKNLER